MKQLVHHLLKKAGFRFINRNKMFKKRLEYLAKYPVNQYKELFLESYEYVIKLENYFPAIHFKDGTTGILVSLEGLEIQVATFEEFFIIAEIFIDYDYNFLLHEEVVVLDIGMNIGIASLFFSKMNAVKKVYGFEPVLDTYENALRNFDLNPTYKSKIIPANIGLGKTTRTETFLYDSQWKGNTGVRGKKSASYKNSKTKETRDVSIVAVSEVFQSILKENATTPIVIKVDCEGAEYEIFEALQASNLVKAAKIYMIEWHDEGSEQIEKILTENNFVVFSRKLAVNSGMLYAYNTVI